MLTAKIVVNGESITMMQKGQAMTVNNDVRKALQENTHIFPELYFFNEGYKCELTGVKNLNGKCAFL